MKAYSYVRFSTKGQATGTSLERQLNASKLFCQVNNLELQHQFSDLGISGFKNVRRPELENMLELIRSGHIQKGSYILIEAIDRLSRKGISHTQDVLKQILQHDIKVAFVGEDARTLAGQVLNKESLNDLSSVILVALAADLAHKESLRKSRLVKASKAIHREKASTGVIQPGHVPFWLRFNKDKYVFTDKLEHVQLIIDLRLKGKGPRGIAKELNQRGIPGPRTTWNHGTISVVLKSPVLYGAYQTHQMINQRRVPDRLIEGYFPAVVPYQTWLLLQSEPGIKGRKSELNPFSGVLYCQCGQAMGFKKHERSNKTYEYHYCIGGTDGRCKLKSVPMLVPFLVHIMDQLVIQKTPVDNTKEIIKAKQDKINQLNQLLLELTDPPLSVLKTIQTLENDITELTKHKRPEITQDDQAKLSSINDTEQYNLLLRRIVKRITVYQLNGPKYLRIKVQKHDQHSQNFLISDGKIKQISDTKKLLDWIKDNR